MYAMTDVTDPSQLLDVEVDQLAGPIPLVSDDRLFRLEFS